VTPYLVEVTDSSGGVLTTIDANDITGVSRNGTTVTINRAAGPVVLDCASLDDAGRLESVLRSSRPVASAAPVQEKKGGFGKKLGIGCLGLIGLIVLVVIVITLASGGDDDEPELVSSNPTRTSASGNATAPATTGTSDNASTFGVGDTAEVGNYLVTLNEVTEPEGDQFNKPKEGSRFIVADVTIENTSDQTQNVSSLLQGKLKDSTGQEYSLSLTAVVASDGKAPDGELLPGEKLRGQFGYEVPTDAEGLTFIFDASMWTNGGRAMFSLDDAS